MADDEHDRSDDMASRPASDTSDKAAPTPSRNDFAADDSVVAALYREKRQGRCPFGDTATNVANWHVIAMQVYAARLEEESHGRGCGAFFARYSLDARASATQTGTVVMPTFLTAKELRFVGVPTSTVTCVRRTSAATSVCYVVAVQQPAGRTPFHLLFAVPTNAVFASTGGWTRAQNDALVETAHECGACEHAFAPDDERIVCATCRCVMYCTRTCQRNDAAAHRAICNA